MLGVSPYLDSQVAPWGRHPEYETCSLKPMCDIKPASHSFLGGYHHSSIPIGCFDVGLVDEKSESTVTEEAANPKSPPSFLLRLPAEIRMQIYSWVNLMTPRQEPQLCPWYPNPTYAEYLLRAVPVPQRQPQSSEQQQNDINITTTTSPTTTTLPRRLLRSDRPLGCMPTALLLTSRQLCAEAQTVPLHDNEFVFVTWFSSGLSAARVFTRALRPWQRDAVRHVRVELHVLDLVVGARLEEWETLCGYWARGLRGLRMTVKMDEGARRYLLDEDLLGGGPAMVFGMRGGKELEPILEQGQGQGVGPGQDDAGQERPRVPRTWSRVPFAWVDKGLRKLRSLRQLEVELVGAGALSDEGRLKWCEALSERLNAGRSSTERVMVVCVEKAKGSGARVKGVKGSSPL